MNDTGTQSDARAPASAPGPVFIAGRQHSGNTVMAVILSKIPGCYAQIDESTLLEHAPVIDRETDPEHKAQSVFRQMRLEAEPLRADIERFLLERAREHPRASAIDLYVAAMGETTRRLGKRFWAQKATSYIFYARRLFEQIPGSRLIYMLRNPYDIAASKKRRKWYQDLYFGTAAGWNRGLRIADELARDFPGRFLLVRFEDMLREPEPVIRGVASFLGEPFDVAYLDVPHINAGNLAYSLAQEGTGFQASRVFYYRDVLGAGGINALDRLVDRRLLEEHYPDLPHLHTPTPAGTKAAGALLRCWAPAHFVLYYLWRQGRRPKVLVARSLQRLRRD